MRQDETTNKLIRKSKLSTSLATALVAKRRSEICLESAPVASQPSSLWKASRRATGGGNATALVAMGGACASVLFTAPDRPPHARPITCRYARLQELTRVPANNCPKTLKDKITNIRDCLRRNQKNLKKTSKASNDEEGVQ